MRRVVTALTFTLAAAAVALPAGAAGVRTARGPLAAVSATSISVRTAHGRVSCRLGAKSPSRVGFMRGENVQIACARTGAGRWLLTVLRHVGTTPTAANDGAPATRFGGAITALSDTSISLHDGDRDLTCAVDSTSPPLTALKVGMHISVSCAGGTLVSWAPVTAGRAYKGKLTALGDTSVTLLSEGGATTCTVAAGSPSRDGFALGDDVLMGCSVGTNQLVLLKHLDGDPGGSVSPPPATSSGDGRPGSGQPSVDQATKGTITVLTDGSVTVHNNEHGDLTCSIGDGSPSLDGFHVGDIAGMGCKAGVLVVLVKQG
jgi:hypothetical protein